MNVEHKVSKNYEQHKTHKHRTCSVGNVKKLIQSDHRNIIRNTNSEHMGYNLDKYISVTMGKPGTLFLVLINTISVQGYGQKQSQQQMEQTKNFEDLYLEGKEAYLDNNYKDCVTKIEAAIKDFKFYTDTVNNCKLKCSKKNENFPSVVKNSPDIVPFEKLIHETLCVMKCKRKTLSKTRVENVDEKTRTEFESKKAYDYLQLCYYQVGDQQSAADAAFTNLVYNPDNQAMRENIKFYMALPEVDENLVKNLESPVKKG